ncbi:TctA family transporter [Spinactinospora alkalitolerans]|uniref:TctA family transporter n=1 Tax=Spinactinospora alkalitolerans TaxID=687207 RepID=A0A852U427_9ACTN|nr:tripartite tricarboxylate transporter permease [Spinactinospora alkalitolerans]NYE50232.1 TctA family transporter [Spinactinospora alkalitolerans]
MIDAALSALAGLLDPAMLATLAIGVLAGLVMGMIPGLGGTGAMAVLLPFVFLLETQQALALVIGAAAVIHTSDTISTVLLGIPGSASSSVTLLDGHTMAKKGQASRALSIAFVSSAAGGLIGALGLTVSIVAARPLVLLFGSPELFMLTVLGISLASLLSRGNIAKGLLAACFGLLLGQVGAAPTSAEYRYTFDSLFLAEGLDLVAVALGVFGLAEIMALIARRTSIADGVALTGGWGQGVRDVLRYWGHVLRGALVGVWAGILPGVGATAGSWLAYGQAVATSKDKRRFGKGDPRGIAAPESANNSISAGDLIPTLLFGIPGSAAAALLLGALLVFGVEPGPSLISEDLDLVYTIVWSFAAAAVLGAVLCFLLAGPLARLSFVRFPILAAGLIVIMFISAFQAAQEFGVLQIMLMLGIIGWFMKMCDYPRAPFLIGFVLSVPLERYYFLTDSLYTPAEWMSRPAVLVMAGLLAAPLLYKGAMWASRRRNAHAPADERVPASVGGGGGDGTSADGSGAGQETGGENAEHGEADHEAGQDTGLFEGTAWPAATAALFVALFGAGLLLSQAYSPSARLVPQLVCTAGLLLALVVTGREVYRLRASPASGSRWRGELGWTAYAFGWLCLFLAITYLVGAVLAAAVFVPVFLRAVARLRYPAIAVYTVAVMALLLVLQFVAGMALPQGWFMPGFLL